MEIFNLKAEGFKISEIAKELGIDRKTVYKYLKLGPENYKPGPVKRNCKSKLDPYEAQIKGLLAKAEEYHEATLSAVFIHDQLAAKGFEGSVSLVRKNLQNNRNDLTKDLIPIIHRDPGKEAQVDWGEKYQPRAGGGRKKIFLFCMTLSHSGTRFSVMFPRANRYYFLLGHILAFEYFGGVPEVVVYDQTRCAINIPGYREVVWNQEFLSFAKHYDFRPKHCLPYRAKTKGKVENLVKYTKRNFLPLREFRSFKQLNQEAEEWLHRVNSQIHSRTGEVPLDALKERERPAMKKLPEIAYQLYCMETRKVFQTSTISYRNKRYSVPPAFLGKMVTVKFKPDQSELNIFFQDDLIARHNQRNDGEKYIILPEHQAEISRIMRQNLKIIQPIIRHRKEDPFAGVLRSLSVYEEAGYEPNRI